MKLDPSDWTALIATVFGEATVEEQRRVTSLTATHPDVAAARGELTRLRELGDSAAKAQGFAANKALSKVRHRIRNETRRTDGRRHLTVRLVATGGFLMTVLAGLVFFGTRLPENPPRVFVTEIGQRATVKLSDGSRVELAPGSKLTVSRSFGARDRTLDLEGEAQFSVASSKGLPFSVRAGGISARVLGTVFTVQRYADEDTARIAVVSGKVVVASRTSERVLTGGSIAHLTNASPIMVTQRDTGEIAAWAEGRLLFHDAPVAHVIKTLARWYGYDLRLMDSTLARQHVTVGLSATDRAEGMRVLCDVLGASMEVRDRVVYLVPLRNVESRSRSAPRTRRFMMPTLEVGK